jgi:hypothetical protein
MVMSPGQYATAFEGEAHQHRNPFCSAPHNAKPPSPSIYFLVNLSFPARGFDFMHIERQLNANFNMDTPIKCAYDCPQ